VSQQLFQNVESFELEAIDISEAEAAVFSRQVLFALEAATLDKLMKTKALDPIKRNGKKFTASGYLAYLWKCSKQRINALADIGEKIDPKYWYPDQPLGLFKAAVEADGAAGMDANDWLLEAIDKNWSPRKLRDMADISKGRRVSRVQFKGRGPVTEWDVETGTVTVMGLPITGEAMTEAEVTVREVLK
jgi:hypothetical protein